MKNVCVIIKNNTENLFLNETAIVADVFSSRGYDFDEIYLFSFDGSSAFIDRIQSLKNAEILLILTPKQTLATVREKITQAFGAETLKAEGIYDDGNRTAFVLTEDEGATGANYAREVCIPYLERKNAIRRERLCIKTVGANPTRLNGLLAQLRENYAKEISVRHTRKHGEDVIALCYDEQTPKMRIDDALRLLAQGLDDSIYALEDISLEEQLVRLLKLRGKKISVAESFTGGGIARRIVSVAGASAVYFEGLNTYNERSKIRRLGVSEQTLKTLGAVSDKTAYEMALGLLKTNECDLAIATTGLAGPKTDAFGQPVGLCYIAVGTKEKIFVYRYQFDGTRKEITEKAINYGLFLAYKTLKNT